MGIEVHPNMVELNERSVFFQSRHIFNWKHILNKWEQYMVMLFLQNKIYQIKHTNLFLNELFALSHRWFVHIQLGLCCRRFYKSILFMSQLLPIGFCKLFIWHPINLLSTSFDERIWIRNGANWWRPTKFGTVHIVFYAVCICTYPQSTDSKNQTDSISRHSL